MRTVAIIPARGGSKGLPGKNIKFLCGKPLLAWTIEQAKASKSIDDVYVTSDSLEILRIAGGYGAKLILRPSSLAGDKSTSEEALLHALKSTGPSDLVVFLQCTAPFRAPKDIDNAVSELITRGFGSLVSVVPTHKFLWRMIDGDAIGINHQAYFPRKLRQELEPQYMETGSIFVMRTGGFLKANQRFFGRIGLYVQEHPWAWVDIDTQEDFDLSEWVMARTLQGATT